MQIYGNLYSTNANAVAAQSRCCFVLFLAQLYPVCDSGSKLQYSIIDIEYKYNYKNFQNIIPIIYICISILPIFISISIYISLHLHTFI